MTENTTIFTQEELQAIAEIFWDFLKDFPDDELYKSIAQKADEMANAS